MSRRRPTRRQAAVATCPLRGDRPPDIVGRFAEDFDRLPPLIPGRGDYRTLIGARRVAAFYAIEGQLAGHGSIELVSVEIDLGHPTSAEPG